MVPLEVNAAGRPVIAFRGGGAIETVVDGVTGVFFNKPTGASLEDAIEEFESRTWQQQRCAGMPRSLIAVSSLFAYYSFLVPWRRHHVPVN